MDLRKAKALIDRLVLEKIALASISRVADVSEVWIQAHISALDAAQPDALCADLPTQAELEKHLADKFDQ